MNGIGTGEINRAGDVLAGDEEARCSAEINVMDPGNILVPGPFSAAQTEADKAKEHIEDSARVRRECDRAPESDFHYAGIGGREESRLPRASDPDGEVPGIRDARFVTAKFTREVVLWVVPREVQRVAVNGSGGGVKPDTWG